MEGKWNFNVDHLSKFATIDANCNGEKPGRV